MHLISFSITLLNIVFKMQSFYQSHPERNWFMCISKLKHLFVLCVLTLCGSAFAADLIGVTKSDWKIVKTPNFEVITDMQEDRAVQFGKDLESFRFLIAQISNIKTIEGLKPTKVLAVAKSADCRKLDFGKDFLGIFLLKPDGTLLVVDAQGYQENESDTNRILHVTQKLYSYHLIRYIESQEHRPVWFDTGYTDYLATLKFNKASISIGKLDGASYQVREFLQNKNDFHVDTEKVFNTKRIPPISQKNEFIRTKFIADSFFSMHFLQSKPNLRASLKDYLQLIERGNDESDAFRKAFGKTHKEFDVDLENYLSGSVTARVFFSDLRALHLPDFDVKISGFSVEDKFRYIFEIFSAFSGIPKDEWADFVRKELELIPGDAKAQLYLAKQKSDAEVNTTARAILAKDPNNVPSLLSLANYLTREAEGKRLVGQSGWQPQLSEARTLLRSAIKNDPINGYAYIDLATIYDYLSDQEPLQEGLVAYDTATIYQANTQTFQRMANLQMRRKLGWELQPALHNALAYNLEPAKSNYGIIADNIEMLADLKNAKSSSSPTGLVFDTGLVYVGEVKDGKPNGTGKLTRPNGSYFEGTFANGLMSGTGKISLTNGYLYQGTFENGIAMGKGKINYPSEHEYISYEGEIYYGLPHAKGTLVSKSGKYDGDFAFALASGTGKFKPSKSELVLSGTWVDGNYIWPESQGTVFSGKISETGKPIGSGKCLEVPSNQITNCTFKDGQKSVDTEESK